MLWLWDYLRDYTWRHWRRKIYSHNHHQAWKWATRIRESGNVSAIQSQATLWLKESFPFMSSWRVCMFFTPCFLLSFLHSLESRRTVVVNNSLHGIVKKEHISLISPSRLMTWNFISPFVHISIWQEYFDFFANCSDTHDWLHTMTVHFALNNPLHLSVVLSELLQLFHFDSWYLILDLSRLRWDQRRDH